MLDIEGIFVVRERWAAENEMLLHAVWEGQGLDSIHGSLCDGGDALHLCILGCIATWGQ